MRADHPRGNWGTLPFSVREKFDGGVVWRHHARCTYE